MLVILVLFLESLESSFNKFEYISNVILKIEELSWNVKPITFIFILS